MSHLATPHPPRSHPGRKSGNIYSTYPGQVASGQAVAAADTLYSYLFYNETEAAITALVLRTLTAGAGSSVKACVARLSPIGRPTGLPILADNTGATTQSNNQTRELTGAAGVLPQGWLAVMSVFTGTLPTMVAMNTNSMLQSFLLGGGTTQLSTTPVLGLSAPFTYSGNLAEQDLGALTWTEVVNVGMPVIYYAAA